MSKVIQSVEPVADPREIGIEPDRIAALLDRAHREIDQGLLPSCQVAVAREGKLAAFTAIGDATPETQYIIWSSTKPIVASAVWVLIGEGAIDPAKRVVEYIPEFGTNGKDVITVEQVMLHTSGFPLAPFDPLDWDDPDRRLARLGQWRLNWEPGTAFEYHATSAHWVLAELIVRASGKDFRDFIRERVTGPLGLTGIHVGYPVSEQRDVATYEPVGHPMSREELEAMAGNLGVPVETLIPPAPGEAENAIESGSLNQAEVRGVGIPGGGGIMRAADLALFYQALLHNPGGVWDDGVLTDATSRVRNSFPDPMMGVPANRSLGVVIAGEDGRSHMRGFGRTTSPRAFGHGGAGGQIGWADPETGISFAYLTNGMDRHVIRQGRRGVALSSLAGLCSTPPE
jgi:CubicO group peptidase (beta-lactamase class C family)